MYAKNILLDASDKKLKEISTFAEDYKSFISTAKTERECVKEAEILALKHGFKNLDDVIKFQQGLKPVDKF